MKPLTGRVSLVLPEDDFDVDQLVGVANIKVYEPERLAALVQDWCGADFVRRHRPGDFIVGGRNFGYGHPHPQAMIAMRHLGVAAVVAESLAPAYQVSEIHRGMLQLACPGILAAVRMGDTLTIDAVQGDVLHHETGRRIACEPLTAGQRAILATGGLFQWLRPTSGAAA